MKPDDPVAALAKAIGCSVAHVAGALDRGKLRIEFTEPPPKPEPMVEHKMEDVLPKPETE